MCHIYLLLYTYLSTLCCFTSFIDFYFSYLYYLFFIYLHIFVILIYIQHSFPFLHSKLLIYHSTASFKFMTFFIAITCINQYTYKHKFLNIIRSVYIMLPFYMSSESTFWYCTANWCIAFCGEDYLPFPSFSQVPIVLSLCKVALLWASLV